MCPDYSVCIYPIAELSALLMHYLIKLILLMDTWGLIHVSPLDASAFVSLFVQNNPEALVDQKCINKAVRVTMGR